MREYDVPYHMRFQIDTDVRCGLWYDVRAKVSHRSLTLQTKCKLAGPHGAMCIPVQSDRWTA
jgi:DNA polymerase elongation subunit (family B)